MNSLLYAKKTSMTENPLSKKKVNDVWRFEFQYFQFMLCFVLTEE